MRLLRRAPTVLPIRAVVLGAIALFCTGAAGPPGGPDVLSVLAALVVILVAAKAVGELFVRLGQPPVLGELLAGVLLGNLTYVGVDAIGPLLGAPSVTVLAELGVLVLLFQVGLESDVGSLLRVGASAFAVAFIGVVTPFALGAGVAMWLLPELTWHAHVFVGAILTATSVGITARVLKDLDEVQSAEGRIILGAAVIDDVLGLIVLAVVSGVIAGASVPGAGVNAVDVLWIIAKAFLFVGGAVVLGRPLSRLSFRTATRLQIGGLLVAVALAFCFVFSWVAGAVGLAPIVGAFAAGLVLDQVTYRSIEEREAQGLEQQVAPIAAFLTPIFFVVTGSKVDLGVFGDPGTLGLALALTVAAVVGKQACGLGVLQRGLDRLSVGLGMIPRGEVGLIFAAVGTSLVLPDGTRVVDAPTNAAVLVMIFVTTLMTPPVLAWSLRRRRS